MKSRNSVFPKFIKQYNKGNSTEQPTYGSCLRLIEIHAERPDYKLAQYYRDGGCWDGAFEMGDNGVLTARTPEIIEGHQAVACTYREWVNSNGHYAALSKEEEQELGIIECTCEGCGEKFKAEEKDYYCCSGYDSIGQPTCGCKGQPISTIVCSETCYIKAVKNATNIYKQLEPIKMSVKMEAMIEDHNRLQDMLKKKAYETLGIPTEQWYDIFKDEVTIIKGTPRSNSPVNLDEYGDEKIDWSIDGKKLRGIGKIIRW